MGGWGAGDLMYSVSVLTYVTDYYLCMCMYLLSTVSKFYRCELYLGWCENWCELVCTGNHMKQPWDGLAAGDVASGEACSARLLAGMERRGHM